jgi:murein DD-endopeptidase MepM/ murein hydrolase activator NlpD
VLIGALLVWWSDPALGSTRPSRAGTAAKKSAASSAIKRGSQPSRKPSKARVKAAPPGRSGKRVTLIDKSDARRDGVLAALLERGAAEAWAQRRLLSLVSPIDLLEFGDQTRQDVRDDSVIERHATVRRGDTIARILRSNDVSRRTAAEFEQAAKDVFDLSRIRPRRSLSLFFDRDSEELAALEYSIDDRNVLVIERNADGRVESRLARTPQSIEVRGVSGTIGESTDADCTEAGVPDRIVSELTDIFGWDVDFDALRPGDRFRAVYEAAIGEDGEVVQTGAILAAEVEAGGRVYTAVYHADDDGVGAFFDPEGRSLERGQLRYPLEFTRVSSEFSESRFHPILRRSRPHNGVDFAAPTGTPVRAIADGVVSLAGWQGDLGNTVRIEHAPAGFPYDSLYGHLSRIALSLSPGAVVRKGEIIGYVGSTGASTGPHLHFALHSGEDYVDPLRLSPPPRIEARVPLGAGFERSRGVLLAALESLRRDGPVRLTRISRQAATYPILLLTY